MAQAAAAKGFGMSTTKEVTAAHISRSLLDRIVSVTGAIMAFALVALGAAAIYGGSFALDNVRDRLEPQGIAFSAASEMTAEEKALVGDFAGQKVDTGTEAEAYSRLIGLHVSEIAGGETYASLGGPLFALEAQIEEAQAAGKDTTAMEAELAGLRGQRDTVFKGETLRAVLLNAYGWWVVGQITLYVGYGAVAVGILLALFAAFGFRHAKKVREA